MNKQEFIKAVLDKYPDWENHEHIVKLKARGLIRLLEQGFDEGFRHAENLRSENNIASGFESMFPWLRK